MLALEALEEIGERVGILDHWKVAARDLDRLDAWQLARDELFPLRPEELVVPRVDELGRDRGILSEWVIADPSLFVLR